MAYTSKTGIIYLNLYVLKGGCNLRFFFNSIRYSEDIDLDFKIIHKDTLYNKIENIFKSMSFKQILLSKGMEVNNLSAPKQTDITQRWKVLLMVNGLTVPLHTKIEFSRRSMSGEVKFEAVNGMIIHSYH